VKSVLNKILLLFLAAALISIGCGEPNLKRRSELRILLGYENEQYYPSEIAAVDSITFSYLDCNMTGELTGTLKAGSVWVPLDIPNGTHGEIIIEAYIGPVQYFRGYRSHIEFPSDTDRILEVTLFDSLPPENPQVNDLMADSAPFLVQGTKEHGTAVFAGSRLVVEIDESINFSFELPLAPGENLITLKSIDRAGNYSPGAEFAFFYGGPTGCSDNDGDGYAGALCGGFDCNDLDPNIAPYLPEIAYDGIDNNCNGVVSNDRDGDGHDLIYLGGDDCNDNDATIFPGAVEYCGDNIDADCDGIVLPCDETDADGDGYSLLDGDCNDTDPTINPLAEEIIYNGVDDDCNLKTPDDDLDRDGFLLSDDCNDTDSSINPGELEIFGDEIDQNCDGESE
jgi:Putative metal-binding motif